MVSSADWQLVVGAACVGARRVNLLDVRSALRAVEGRALRHPGPRQICLTDNAVGIGSLAQGRSSSPALNAELQRGFPAMTGFNFYPALTSPRRGSTLARRGAGRGGALAARSFFGCGTRSRGKCDNVLRWAELPRQRRCCSEWTWIVFELLDSSAPWATPARARGNGAAARGLSAQRSTSRRCAG